MNLVFSDNRLNGWDVRDLMAFGLSLDGGSEGHGLQVPCTLGAVHHSHPTQHNANHGRDFRRPARAQALSRRGKRDVTTRPHVASQPPFSPQLSRLSLRPGLSSVWTAEDVPKTSSCDR